MKHEGHKATEGKWCQTKMEAKAHALQGGEEEEEENKFVLVGDKKIWGGVQ
jgi:hypothetical protein